MQKPTSFIMDCRLTYKEFLNDRYVLMKYEMPEPLPAAYAGQFAQVRIDGSPTTYLRRPISICLINQGHELWLLVQLVGDGTKVLAKAETGDLINMILPLGNGFTIPEAPQKCLLVGGGVGVAPMLMLGRQLLESGHTVNFLLGGRTATDLVLLQDFSSVGQVYCTTEDGSAGEKGFVTNHSILAQSFDRIYACGPKPMMKAVAAYAKKNDTFCEVSLENLMACGIGACLCCVEDTVNGHVCTCTDGPVFNTNLLKW
ncbi:MAG: dihydroorotate dehydrogenase electron transfer subunit [Bacteroidota bacterium]|nr:dihydroorotate dehydrogenase electron transfer subunit [Bacteroidota bacterium]